MSFGRNLHKKRSAVPAIVFKQTRRSLTLTCGGIIRVGNGGRSPPFFFTSVLDKISACRHPPSPDSPAPYVALERKNISPFPSAEDGAEPLRADGLVNYISNFNRDNKCKLHIWRRTRGTPLTDQPSVLRFGIHDVLIAYLSLVYSQADTVLICESVTFFAPREKVSIYLAPIAHLY